MNMKRIGVGTILAALVAAVAVGVGMRAAEPVTGESLERASAVALQYFGEATVTETEVGDEDGYYEVEVTLADGSQIDVHLDASFEVIGTEADVEDTGTEEDGPED